MRQAASPRAGPAPALWLAWARLALVPVLLLEEWVLDRPGLDIEDMEIILGVAWIYAIVSVLLAQRSPARPPGGWLPFAALDLLFLSLLTLTSGGATSPLRYGFTLLPVGAAFLGRPRHTAWAIAASLAAYTVVAAIEPPDGPNRAGTVAVHVAALAWQCLLALVLSMLLTRRSDEVAELAETRRELLVRVQEADQRARVKLAYDLHDGPVQNLLAVRFEIRRARRGHPEALDDAEAGIGTTVAELRAAILDLHPHTLDHAGVEAALRRVAERQARERGVRMGILISPDATGVHDEIVYNVGRELLLNAARHARAARADLVLERRDGEVVLTVDDDGRGFEPTDEEAAVRSGHVGLAACRARVEAVGGTMAIHSDPGTGTQVQIRLPAAPANGGPPAREVEDGPGAG